MLHHAFLFCEDRSNVMRTMNRAAATRNRGMYIVRGTRPAQISTSISVMSPMADEAVDVDCFRIDHSVPLMIGSNITSESAKSNQLTSALRRVNLPQTAGDQVFSWANSCARRS